MTEETRSPAVTVVDGVEFVTVPRTYFRDLVRQGGQAGNDAGISPERLHATMRRRVDQDEEVRAFITECLGRVTAVQAVTACRERFGAERTPSKSAVDRFWRHVRERENPHGDARPSKRKG